MYWECGPMNIRHILHYMYIINLVHVVGLFVSKALYLVCRWARISAFIWAMVSRGDCSQIILPNLDKTCTQFFPNKTDQPGKANRQIERPTTPHFPYNAEPYKTLSHTYLTIYRQPRVLPHDHRRFIVALDPPLSKDIHARSRNWEHRHMFLIPGSEYNIQNNIFTR